MKHLINKLTIGMAGLILIFAVNGCCEDEPVIIVPVPDSASPIIFGMITTNNSISLQDVTVTISSGEQTYSAVTDAEGWYSITVPAGGTYAISAAKSGYSSVGGAVVAVSNDVSVWNALLTKSVVTNLPVKVEGSKVNVTIPPLVETTAKAEMLTFDFDNECVSEDDELIVVVEYDKLQLQQSKAGQLVSLLVAHYSLASGKSLTKEIDITVSVPVDAEEVLLNGKAVQRTFDPAKGIVFKTKELGTLVLNYMVDIKENVSTTGVEFEQSVYDNFYGSGPMNVVNPKYTLKSGGDLQGNQSMLNSFAASYTGITSSSATGAGLNTTSKMMEYPLDITLPVGGKLLLEGTQKVVKYSFSVANGEMKSDVVAYKGVEIKATTVNRQHIGGSN